jgi:hypothetical protein
MMNQERECVDQMRTHAIMWDQYVRAGQQALRLKNCTEAERMFNLAFERSREFGDKDQRVAESLRWIVKTHMDRGDYRKAELAANRLMEHLYTHLGEDNPETLLGMRLCAAIYAKQAKFTEGAKLLRHVLDHHPKRHTARLDPEFLAIQNEYNSMRARTSSDYDYHLIYNS